MVDAVLRLANVSHVVVRNLELTNAGDSIAVHRRPYVTAGSATVRDVTIHGVTVHDVDSSTGFDEADKRSGGIVGEALGTGRSLSRTTWAMWPGRASPSTAPPTARPAATRPWPQASTRVVIRGITVERVAGDGIVPLGTAGALVEHNTVRDGNLVGFDFLSDRRNCSAGIWTWNANRTLIQNNEVSGMHYGSSGPTGAGCDGDAFDVDSNQDGTVIQYNYSHDNDGGFLLLCTDGADHHADVRYNLSVNDAATFSRRHAQAT